MLPKPTLTHRAFTLLITLTVFLSLTFLLKPARVGASRPASLPAHAPRVNLSSSTPPAEPPAGAIIVDDRDPGFVRAGPSKFWWFPNYPPYSYYRGGMTYTFNADQPPMPTNWATWTTAPLPATGNYSLYVFIPLQYAETRGALYQIIAPSGIKTPILIDQYKNRGKWVGLGTYPYNAGDTGKVLLDDVVLESQVVRRVKIAYDAMVWLPPGVAFAPSASVLPYDPLWAELGWRLWGARAGEPVLTALGSFYAAHQDLVVPGPGLKVDFTRTYNSYDTRLGAFGLGWRSTYDASAVDRGNGEIIVTLADGRAGLYVPDGSGGYTRPPAFFANLRKAGDEFILTDTDQTVYTFDVTSGKLVSLADSNGNRLTLAYNLNDYTLTDTAGRQFQVAADAEGFIHQIVDPSGRTYTYDYDGNQLVAFHDAAGGVTRYAYDGNGWMASITNPNGHTLVTNYYDGQGRVTSQTDASGSTTTFAYQDSPRVTTVTDNNGHPTVQEFDDKYRLVKETDALGHSTVYAYDGNNNRTYVKDPNGHETFMTYDAQGNMLTRKDALGQTATFTYNAQNHLTDTRDEAGAETILEYDPRGNLLHVHDAEGGDTRMTYDQRGLMLTLQDPNRHTTQFIYDGQGNLQTVKGALNNVTTFAHDKVGRQTAMTDANGHTVKFAYDPNDHVIRLTDPKSQPTVFTYDPVGNLIRLTDRRGGQTTYVYNENEILVKVTDPLGHASSFTYEKMYHRASYTNPRGFTTTYTYDAVYNVAQVIDAKGNPTTLGYDADHNPVSLTDALNQVTKFEYDPLHRLVKVTGALGGVTRYSYDPVGRLVQIQDPKGGLTRSAYDRLGRLRQRTDALSNVSAFGYDPVGNRLSATDARGNTTRYTYDALNRLIKQASPLGNTWQLSYDGVDNLVSIVDPRGNSTTFAYDANDNRVDITDALSGHLKSAYNAADQPISVTDANGNTTTTTYDLLGNATNVTLPLGQVTAFQYDANRNLIAVTNAKGKTTRLAYDELDLLKSQTNPLNFVTAYSYDKLRRLAQVTDANGNATRYGYDALDRLIDVTDALNGHTKYAYDPLSNLTAITDANGNRTTFDVDLLGRVTRETNPLGKSWQYGYDPVGNLIKRTDANGAVTQSTFDADNRLTQITYPSGPGVRLAYDANDNRVSMVDASGASAFTYDKLNRLTQVQRVSGLLAKTILGYAYDAVSNRTKITYPDGKVMTYAYNANNWLTSVTDPLKGVTTYQSDAVGLPTHIADPNRTWADYTYDDADRLVKLFNGKPEASSNLISSFEYTLDKVGNRTRTVEKDTRGQIVTWTKNYTYDKLYRLIKDVETPDFKPPQVLTSLFTYDPVGNRLSMTTNIADKPNTPALPSASTTNYTYDKANEMLTAGAVKFTYDANGNRVSLSGPTRAINYTYDFENRLTGAKTADVLKSGKLQPDSTLDYTYDGLGRRVERGVVDQGVRKTADFLYDGLGYDLLAQYVNPGSPRTTYYYRDLTQIISRHEIQGQGAGLQYFQHYDGLGNVSAWTNQSGHEVQEYSYAPYGRLIDNNGPDNASNKTDPHTNLTWSGKPWDPETELNYFGARDYDPATGTWIEQDPYRGRLMEPATLHRTMYVNDNPINGVDEYGFSTGCSGLYGSIYQSRPAVYQFGPRWSKDSPNRVLYGKKSCWLVAAAAAMNPGNLVNMVNDMKEIAAAVLPDSRTLPADIGIYPMPYYNALKQVYDPGQGIVTAMKGQSFDTTICGIAQALELKKIAIVEFIANDQGPTTTYPDFVHYARVLEVDFNNNMIYLENTLTEDGKPWQVSFPDFKAAWAISEIPMYKPTTALSRKLTERNFDNFVVIIDPSF